jgi:sulfite exporter TauE/SafE
VEKLLEKDEIVSLAKKNLVEGERWHKKVNVREIVFGFNDGSISTLALLAGVTGGALAHGQILVAGLSRVIAGAISMAIGAYISSKSEIEHHRSEIEREKREIEDIPEVAEETVKICKRLGITKVWMQPGSESETAIKFCLEKGIQILYGLCVMVERAKHSTSN